MKIQEIATSSKKGATFHSGFVLRRPVPKLSQDPIDTPLLPPSRLPFELLAPEVDLKRARAVRDAYRCVDVDRFLHRRVVIDLSPLCLRGIKYGGEGSRKSFAIVRVEKRPKAAARRGEFVPASDDVVALDCGDAGLLDRPPGTGIVDVLHVIYAAFGVVEVDPAVVEVQGSALSVPPGQPVRGVGQGLHPYVPSCGSD